MRSSFAILSLALLPSAAAFVPVGRVPLQAQSAGRVLHPTTATTKKVATTTTKAPFEASTQLSAIQFPDVSAQTQSITSSPLFEYFVQSLISNGVPTFFVIITIGFVFSRLSKMANKDQGVDGESVIAELYNDLYGNQGSRGARPGGFGGFGPLQKKPRNIGVPKDQYLKITNVNQIYDSYEYSLSAATKSKASAAATYRSKAFDRAFKLVMKGEEDMPKHVKSQLIEAEKDFLKKGGKLMVQLQAVQKSLAQQVIDSEIKSMGVDITLDPAPINETEVQAKSNETTGIDLSMLTMKDKDAGKSQAMQTISKLQREITQLELNFVTAVVGAVGPQRAIGVRTALLGDIAARGIGALLTQLQERPLAAILDSPRGESVFVARFPGDTTASQVANLRQEVTAIVRNAQPGDQVLLVLQTGGGTVTGYGLAAAQLLRLKEAGLKLTIAVEQVAASGGYMMCCIADHIVASPFAVLGSIGVISEIPNVYERLKKEGIEFQTVTAGKFKRTLTPTKRVTKEDFEKSKEDVEEILGLFSDFVAKNRPQLEIEKVATGETWFGTAAMEKGLCDEIKTVDDVITEFVDSGRTVYEVQYSPPPEVPNLPFAFASAENEGNWIRRSIRWAVRTIADEVRAELSGASSGMTDGDKIERRYMARDDTSDRTFMK